MWFARSRLECIVRQRIPLPQNLRIEVPCRVVEHGCETHPHQIWNEQRARQWPDSPECNKRCNDEHPKQNDICESHAAQVPPEEQPAPERIDCQLNQEQGERCSCRTEPTDTPDQPCRNAHEHVKDRPDRAEQLGWRRPLRSYELRVERSGPDSRGTANSGSNEADREPGNEPNSLLALWQSHDSISSIFETVHTTRCIHPKSPISVFQDTSNMGAAKTVRARIAGE